MWVVVYVAPSAVVADRLLDNLNEKGIFARCQPIETKDGVVRQHEILVSEAEADEASQLLGSALMGR